jgi:PKD repeat protein
LEKDKMITGDPNAQMLFFNLGTSYGSLLPADWDGSTAPPAGSPNYLANLGANSLRIWQASVDWTNTSNSSVSLIKTLTTQSFSYSGITINQPGTSQTLDPLQDRLMHRLQYRNFGNYQVMLTNHTVNANGAGQAGVRWYELRNYGSGWNIYQQGTYAPNDGDDRWMASIAMNGNGDIGLGYSVSSSSTYPSIRFTGQTAAQSGTGQMDVTETSIKAGSKSQTGVNRWGDYSMMSIDPSNDATFWYTNEYSNGGWSWMTQIASFSFGSSSVSPPVANFSGTPTSILVGGSVNFTDLSTNNPTSWSWTFLGGTSSTSTLQNPTVTYNTAGTYNVTLTASNSVGSNTLTKSGYITVSPNATTYCSSSGTSTSKEWIKSVGIGGTTYTSNNNSGYGDFTSVTFNVVAGSNSLTLIPGYSGATRAEYWKVWIDFNGDKDFDDAGEQVFTANKKKGTVTGTFTIPTEWSYPTRMRVSMKYGSAPSSCEQFAYGEVEDYTVTLSSAKQGGIAQRTGDSENNITSASVKGKLELNVYPNPANDILNIEVTNAAETVNVKIYNALGQIINNFNINNDKAIINLKSFTKGIYYVGVDDGTQNALKKFIKE